MPSRIYCKNSHIVAADPVEARAARTQSNVSFLGREVSIAQGHASAGGVLLLNTDELVTSPSCHEVEVHASGVRGVSPGDRVIVFLGGDTQGEVSANGISAFVKVDGQERYIIHSAFIWAKVKDGEILPLGRIALTERNDAAFRQHALGPASVLFTPDAQLEHGMRATGDDAGEQVLASVTALYETVVRTGPDVRDLNRGEVVCFSPSFAATKLKRRVGSETKYYHLIDTDDAFFSVEG
jgi:hypothetical protein